MATTLNEALVQIIQSTQGAVEKGIGFLSDQIPDVIQQLLLWKFAEALAYTAVGVLGLVIIAVLLFKHAIRRVDKVVQTPGRYDTEKTIYKESLVYDKDGDVHFGVIILGLGSFFGGIISLCAAESVFTALQIWLAPKVFLIEYASKLVS